jgi:cold shock CspA family protein
MVTEATRLVERVTVWRGSYGFCWPSGAFIHVSDLEDREQVPEEGQHVSFEMIKTPKGPRGRHVRIEG